MATSNQCRFCKVMFPVKDPNEHVCTDCLAEMKKVLSEDEKLKYQFLEIVIKDEVCIERIAKAVFTVPVKNVGIGGEGSLAEFFRKDRKAST